MKTELTLCLTVVILSVTGCDQVSRALNGQSVKSSGAAQNGGQSGTGGFVPGGAAGAIANGGAAGSGAAGQGGTSGAAGSPSSGDAGVSAGLPCEIQNLVVTYCSSCHGSSLAGGSPRSLATYANLTMTDPSNPSLTEAQMSLQRMQNTAAPMPPSPAAPVPATAVAAFQTWITSGYPKGTCSAGSGGSGAGGSGGGGSGAAAPWPEATRALPAEPCPATCRRCW